MHCGYYNAFLYNNYLLKLWIPKFLMVFMKQIKKKVLINKKICDPQLYHELRLVL